MTSTSTSTTSTSTSTSMTGPKQISLEELGKLEVPYGRSKIFKAYKDAGFLDRRDESTNERGFRTHFYPLATGAQKDRPRTITKEVQGIYRLKHKGKEYLMYHALFRGTDWKKNPIDFTLFMGRYDIPEFQYEVDPHTDQVIPEKTQVRGYSTRYDIEFTKAKVQELINMAAEDSPLGLTVIDQTGKKWSCGREEFINDNEDYDKLVDRKTGFAKYIEDRNNQKSQR